MIYRRLLGISLGLLALVLVACGPAAENLPEAALPDTINRYSDLQRGVSPEGFAMLGNPDAPVNVIVYESYGAPDALAFHQSLYLDLLQRVRTGQITYSSAPLNVGIYLDLQFTVDAVVCAGRQGHYWQMHDALYNWQAIYGQEAFSQERFVAGAVNLGLNRSDFENCMERGRGIDFLDRALSAGYSDVPTIVINGEVVPAQPIAIESVINRYGPFDNLAPGTVDPAASQTD